MKNLSINKIKPILFYFIFLFFIFFASCKGEEPTIQPPQNDTLTIVDKNSTTETKALYAQLWQLQKRGFMFGHHDDLWYGRKWFNELGRSDTKDVCGDYPAVFSVDLAEVMDDRYLNNLNNDIKKRCIIEAGNRGEVILACCHLNNPLTNGDAWDNSNINTVKEVLNEGSVTNLRFKSWLDRLADFAVSLKTQNGKLIPIIFRPFHEHNKSWSWWGTQTTSKGEFIVLWKFTVNYLRDVKKVHQFIYAISPQLDAVQTRQDYLYAYPGDDYVDFLGMDCYHGLNTTAFMTNLRNLEILSQEKSKPCGVTETGVEGIKYSDGTPIINFWTNNILTPLKERKISMVVMWRNKYDPNESGMHFFSVFQGHASAPDFVEMYNANQSLFSKDLPDMYKLPENVVVN
ncbi:conserved hypothetical protein [uncultured Paludibacter sp.]|uniref:GH26 domain-containing protein n=1 Tax=uncultured Paludibacter sp. TaxID=497635 RepID=A0A653ACQ8_9BACT|nr:conserved hypothetical protein [uncultured Paludibacter sp.]